MKKILFILLCLCGLNVKGQHITDHNLAIQIWNNCNTCIDTTTQNLLPDAIFMVGIGLGYNLPITNWMELELLPSLTRLSLSTDGEILSDLPLLPEQITSISCIQCDLLSISNLSDSLVYINMEESSISGDITLPTYCKQVYLSTNHISSINNIPVNCEHFDLSFNLLTTIPNIPASVSNLTIYGNNISCLPLLPTGLDTLQIDDRNCLPNLPISINSIFVFYPNGSNDPEYPATSYPLCNIYNASSCGQYIPISGQLFTDYNANGIQDENDLPISNKIVSTSPGWYSCISDSMGFYEFFVDTNNSYLIIPPNIGIGFNVPSLYSITTVDSLGQMFSNINFSYVPIPNTTDLSIDISATTPRPGFEQTYYVTYTNIGTEQLSGTVNLTVDAALQFVDSDVTPTNINGSTYEWDITNLPLFESHTIAIRFLVPTSQTLGSELAASVSGITTISDADTTNNLDVLSNIVVGSYDPNDKTVSPSSITPAQAASHPKLEYIIRFQNTGTAEAINILVTDTLSNSLDISTLEIIASSHPVNASLSREMLSPHRQVLKFHFDNIMLPDSNTSEPLSHGFVKFSIRLSDTLQIGESLGNIANIYFDFNEPVITNEALLENPLITFTSNSAIPISLSPNPTTGIIRFQNIQGLEDITVIDIMGRVVWTGKPHRRQIDLSGLEEGLYTLRTSTGKAAKVVVQR